jgi:MFS family permease
MCMPIPSGPHLRLGAGAGGGSPRRIRGIEEARHAISSAGSPDDSGSGAQPSARRGDGQFGWLRQGSLIDLRFFRSAPFSGATVIAVCAFAALGGFLFLNTLYLQDVRGYSALHAGMFMLPMAAMIVVCAPLSGRILAARGPRLPLVVAGLAIMASGAMLTRLATGTPASWLITCYLALGVGTGMVNPAITNTAVSSMPPSQAGVAAAIASTSRQVGTALGVAVMGSAVLSALHRPLRLGFAGASHVGWWIIAGCGAAVLLLAIITTGRWAKATAERAASRTAPGSPKVPVSS